MKDVLSQRLHAYIAHNNPDLLVTLQEEKKVTEYLNQKVTAIQPLVIELQEQSTPDYIIEDMCLKEMTADLRPSKYNYLRMVLEEDFETEYSQFRETGILTYELINLIRFCDSVFTSFEFSEEKENERSLRYAIIGSIKEYLDNREGMST